MNTIKRLITYLVGGKDEFVLEHQILNAMLLLATICAPIITIGTLLLDFGLAHRLIVVFIGACGIGIYYLSRFRRIRLIKTIILLLFGLLSVIWFTGYGSRGGDPLFFLFCAIFSLILLKGAVRYLFFFMTPVVVAGLTLCEHLNPGSVKSYASEADRVADYLMNYVTWIVVVGFIFKFVVDSYFEEREKLEVRNFIMNRELDMAREVQRKLIPVGPPWERIAFRYMPMMKVGGDYFDFIRFREADRIGIFISDVCGHGVPSALIASMVKSVVLKTGDERTDPAQFLFGLNKTLFGNTGAMFVTALYGIFDRRDNTFVYSSAGHVSPFHVHDARADSLSTESIGVPVGIVSNDEIRAKYNPYVDETVRCEPGDKIVLCTDGLLEVLGPQSGEEFFGARALAEVMAKHAALPADAFAGAIVDEVTRFHGGDEFDDDLCLVCIEAGG